MLWVSVQYPVSVMPFHVSSGDRLREIERTAFSCLIFKGFVINQIHNTLSLPFPPFGVQIYQVFVGSEI